MPSAAPFATADRTAASESSAPFPAFPAANRYVELGTTGETLGRLFRSIDAREAISLVVGPPGVGKSMLCDLVAEGHRDSHDVVMLNRAPIEHRDSLIQHLLHGLRVTPDNSSDLHLQLVDRVCSDAARSGLLIVVDECQSLADEVLEAIRMVTNITANGQRRVMAVLCGSNQVDDRLANPKMEPLVQRIATRCYLHPLSEGETRTYIRQTITQCGGDADATIDDAAAAAVYLATGGVPRLINQMMTEAIDVAARANQSMIDQDIVHTAWANLQQLPAPMIDEAVIGPVGGNDSPSNVQFGQLSEDREADRSQDDELTLAPEPIVIPAAPDEMELFGEFVDEETIPTGHPVVTATATGPTIVGRDASFGTDLEQSLRREVDEMLSDASQSIAMEIDDDRPPQALSDQTTTAADLADTVEEPQLSVAGLDAELVDEPESVVGGSIQPAVRDDTMESREQARRGDADMLIVDDTIEMVLETEEESESVVQSAIDFQAMMSRMRAGA